MITRKEYEIDPSETFWNREEYATTLNIILAHLCADFQGSELQRSLPSC